MCAIQVLWFRLGNICLANKQSQATIVVVTQGRQHKTKGYAWPEEVKPPVFSFLQNDSACTYQDTLEFALFVCSTKSERMSWVSHFEI